MTRKSSDGRKAPKENAPMRYDKAKLYSTTSSKYVGWSKAFNRVSVYRL